MEDVKLVKAEKNGTWKKNVAIYVSIITLMILIGGMALSQGKTVQKVEDNTVAIKELKIHTEDCNINMMEIRTDVKYIRENIQEIKEELKGE